MGRSRWSLTPWLVLGCAASSAWATKRPFNIHDDLLAYPQYQVLFPEDYVLESQAEDLLRSHASPENPDSSVAQNDPQIYTGKDHSDTTPSGEEDTRPRYTYEEMVLDDRRLLCQIPRVSTDGSNSTAGRANQEADEQNELARATDRGLELLREMEGQCMYYFSGWWSYSFCYRNQIKQFHARPAGGGVPSYPPVEDPNAHSFVLGRFQENPSEDRKGDEKKQKKQTGTDLAELRTKGGSRYLVQHLGGGTKCDLTGRDRKVEVQFHCHPQSTDQIGWIKELTTCSYLMVIYTPRLCDDVAFLPPQQDEVHNIECREILRPEDVSEWESAKEWYQAHQLADAAAAAAHSEVQTVGGIVVGGQQLVGMEGKKIEKGRVASAGEETVEVVLKRENGEIQRPSKQVMKKYNIDQETIENMKRKLDAVAEGRDWTLEVVESNGVIKLQGAIEKDEDEAEEQKDGDASSQQSAHQGEDEPAPLADGDGAGVTESRTPESESETAQDSKLPQQTSEDEGEDSAGSEETFKDEL